MTNKWREWLVFIDGKVFNSTFLGKMFTEDEADVVIEYYRQYAIWSVGKYNIIDGREEMEDIK